MAEMAGRRQRDWQVLQELAGIVTPFTAQVRAEAEAAVAAAHEQELAKLKQEHDQQLANLREEYRAEMAQVIKQRLLALAASAPMPAPPAGGNGEQVEE
jgi:pyruvate-ferredoxin/flavodoxin oxidoreductase